MIRLNDITSRVCEYHPNANVELIEKAYVYSAQAHQGQIRLSGEPYLSHPLEVANILARMKMDVVCIAAGLLHDTIEDTDATKEEITRLFGEETANIVEGVTKIGKIEFASHEYRQAENIRKMILAMASDIRVIMVKLADRLHNMRTLGFQPEEKQKRIAQETLDIYAPIAGRMGIFWLRSNLEDLCFYYLDPESYKKVDAEVAQRRSERVEFIRNVIDILSQKLKEAGIEATIKGRHKHLYSIYKKMITQNLSPGQVYDVLAFRVIVQNVKECYAALGIIHSIWKQVPLRFKDYISVPKENMYQSLHTTVIGPVGQRMEIQIRTWEMDRIAEEGIAAHWKYKEGGTASKVEAEQFSWLRQLLEWQRHLKDPTEFMESVRLDLFPNNVYIFTPTGEVKSLPKGATPIDFAYSIHSEVGKRCIAAKVNGKIVPLRYELKNGETVEIITSPKQHPSADWLNYVRTPRAKNRIRQWLRTQEREEAIKLGKELLAKSLKQDHLNLETIIKKDTLLSVAKEFSINSTEDLLAQIGLGTISLRHVVGQIKTHLGIKKKKRPGLVEKAVDRIKWRKKDRGIKIKGVSNVLIHFPKCCHPVPGDPVVGYITRGRGVTIHHPDCPHVLGTDPDRLIEVSWDPAETETYPARLKVVSSDSKGVLADISSRIAQKDINIIKASVKTTIDNKGIGIFTISVRDKKQIQDAIDSIRKLKNIITAERI